MLNRLNAWIKYLSYIDVRKNFMEILYNLVTHVEK